MIIINDTTIPYTENQTIEQLIKSLMEDPQHALVFSSNECIVMRNGRIIPPAKRGDLVVEDKDEFTIFPTVSGG
jgi:thiamine biosynthesis protein ThiS